MAETVGSIQIHHVVLQGCGAYGARLLLRPMSEGDSLSLHKWNNDPDVLLFSEGDEVVSRTMEETMSVYRQVSKTAFCFVAELDGRPIGECWLQRMNLQHVLDKYGGLDCRRVDLMIGEPALWGKDIGTEMIATLTLFGCDTEDADVLFGMVSSHNGRSLRAFEKAGYRETGRKQLPSGGKAEFEIEMSYPKPGGSADRPSRQEA
jgi:aminoglycoside 6'-N-acetyltransferase